MTDFHTLLSLLDRWVTVTHPGTSHRVSYGRLVMVMEQPSIGIELPGGGKETFPAAFHVEAADPTAVLPPDAGQPHPWADLRTSGLLWLINRTAFHPRGVALAVHTDKRGASGWSLMANEDREPYTFDPATDDDGHRRAEATLAAILKPARLLACGWCYEEHGEEVHPHPECPIGRRGPTDRRTHLDREQLVEQTKPDTDIPCCVCGGGPVVYDNYKGQLFCWRCADCDCGRDGPCIRTGLHRPVQTWACTATFNEGFHGRARCERHHATDPHGRPGPWHEGRSEDGSTLFWQDGDNGATPHRPDAVRTPCPDTDTTARTPEDTPALTSTDTVRTACPDSERTPGPDTTRTPCPDTHADAVRTVWTASVPRRQMGAALGEALGMVFRAPDQDIDEAADEEPDPDDEPCPLGPDGLTDVERQLMTIREAMKAELSQPDEHALWDLALAVNRAVHAMPRYGVTSAATTEALTRSPADLLAVERERNTVREALARISRYSPGRPADDHQVPEITALRDRVGELADALADALGRFTIPALVDGRAHVRTGYTPVTLVEQWRTVHAGRSLSTRTFPLVQGRCPACTCKTLFLGSGGWVTCSNEPCTEPDAAASTLATAYAQAGAHERALRNAAAYQAVRGDIITAASYIRQQAGAGPLSPLRHNRARVLDCLPTWIKDPGPLDPPTTAADQ